MVKYFLGGLVVITGVLFMTSPDVSVLRTQISEDISSGIPLGGLLGGMASQIAPIQTRDWGLIKVAQVADGPMYVGVLGRWIQIPDQ